MIQTVNKLLCDGVRLMCGKLYTTKTLGALPLNCGDDNVTSRRGGQTALRQQQQREGRVLTAYVLTAYECVIAINEGQ
jgi:hypothetical protein